MKKLITLLSLVILSLTSFAQQESWVTIEVQYDYFAITESTWFLVENESGDTVVFHQPTYAYEYYETTVLLPSGEYELTLTDSYGDGWISNSNGELDEGWVKMYNSCQGEILGIDATVVFFTLDTLVNILPCAPPTCNPIDVAYTVTPDNLNVLIDWSWDQQEHSFCNIESVFYGTDINNLTEYSPDVWYGYSIGQYFPSQDGTVYFYAVTYEGVVTDTIEITTSDPVIGCTDPIGFNYNPDANVSSYSGYVEGSSCSTSEWSDNFVGISLDYYYDNISQFSVGTEILFNNYTYYIDAINIPVNCNQGVALVYVQLDPSLCDGNPWTYTEGALQGSVIVGSLWSIPICEYIEGCVDPASLNYNPNATLDDGSCQYVEGCTNPSSANYNPAATQDDQTCLNSTVVCSPGKVLVTVEILLDQYANETSWILKDASNILSSVNQGDYTGSPMGSIQTSDVCVDEGTQVEFTIADSYGDGLGGAQFGGIDGSWVVYTACDTISIGVGDFIFSHTDTATILPCTSDIISGCTDNNYVEFNILALVDDLTSCQTLKIYGCTDINTFNYDSNANAMLDNGGCENQLILTDWAGNGWAGSSIIITQGDQYWGPFTCLTDSFVTNIPLITSIPVKAFFYTAGQSSSTAEQCMFQVVNPDGTIILEGGTNPYTNPVMENPYMYMGIPYCGNVCIDKVYGCTVSDAFNYKPTANTEIVPSNCYWSPGCTSPAYVEYHSQGFIADFDNGNCDTLALFGCMDIESFNYDSYATVNWNMATDSSDPCVPKVYGCTDNTAFNFNTLANTNNGSCIPIMFGCTDPNMYNYNPFTNTDDGSCISILLGCTDPSALNYDPSANTDNFSCVLPIYGCTDDVMFNYNSSANVDNGSCIPFIYGCNNSTAFNFDPLSNTSDNSCCYISGCTNPEALNYDVNVCFDDNSCIQIITGCTDVGAFNYDPSANVSDSLTCLFDAGCYGGPGVPYWLNDGCYSWVIDVDDYCCNNEWDSYCEAQYNYCVEGWPIGLDDLLSRDSEISVYPNPTNNYLYIATKLELEIKLYDMKGILITEGETSIDMSIVSPGVYNLHIIYKGSTINHKIIKQ